MPESAFVAASLQRPLVLTRVSLAELLLQFTSCGGVLGYSRLHSVVR